MHRGVSLPDAWRFNAPGGAGRVAEAPDPRAVRGLPRDHVDLVEGAACPKGWRSWRDRVKTGRDPIGLFAISPVEGLSLFVSRGAEVDKFLGGQAFW